MRHLVEFAVTLCIAGSSFAQEKLPPRFEPLLKNERLRLVRVLGMPELRPSFLPTSAISADGKWALFAEDLSTGDDEKPSLKTRLLLYDLQAKTWPREFEIGGTLVTALDLSQDGGKAILAGRHIDAKQKAKEPKKESPPLKASLIVFDLRAGKAIRIMTGADTVFQCFALAPDGSAALTASPTKLTQWDLTEGKPTVAYDAKDAAHLGTLAYLPGGKQFLAGYSAGKIRLFDVGKDNAVRDYQGIGKDDLVSQLAVSAGGKHFAAGELRSGVTVWETATGKQIGKWTPEKRLGERLLSGLALGDDGKTVVAVWSNPDPALDDAASAELLAWDAEANKTLWSHPIHFRGLVPMIVKDGEVLAGGGPNFLVSRPLGVRAAFPKIRGAHTGAVNALAVLANGDFVSAGQDAVMNTWRAGEIATRSISYRGAIGALAAGKDQKRWLRSWPNGEIEVNPADRGYKPPLHILKGHNGPVTSLAFSTDGNWAASGSADRAAKTWDLKSGKEFATFAGHSEAVNAVAVSPDDRWLATGSDDTTIRLWPIKGGKLDPDREAITLEGHKKPVTCLAFSADGKTLISGSQDQTLKVWDWAREKAIRTIAGHKNWITSLLLVDAKTALTTSDDLTLRWWDLDSGKEIGQLDFGVVGDCPRCLARLGPHRVLVGSSSWLIYELQMQSAKGADSSK